MTWVAALCEGRLGRRTGSRDTQAKAYAVAALHSCIVPRQFILPFTQTTLRQNRWSVDALQGTAVESSPQKTSTPAQVLCDRLRPSKNCRLKIVSADSTDHQQKTARQPFRRGKVLGTTQERQRNCTALHSHRSNSLASPRLLRTRLLIRPHSHSTAFETLG